MGSALAHAGAALPMYGIATPHHAVPLLIIDLEELAQLKSIVVAVAKLCTQTLTHRANHLGKAFAAATDQQARKWVSVPLRWE
jgi:hypothetical protein